MTHPNVLTTTKTPDQTNVSLDDVNTMTQRIDKRQDLSGESREHTRGDVASWN